ncbi:insulinase family protein [Litorilituus lipolyticus]|uniref:Protease 3 n=1 Tax=Litorilituus lipolyticus TaxID=2491017 RepID=A0A502L659_9GAMM|nr:insulinase family protein [Litorilituus lipolyticus]TPH17945.1 peptidase M16 [Litorilituus lipolyticus]
MKQSPNDLKEYQPLKLKNGLRVLLISNTESDKAAAALAVNVGHFNDPKDREGLAHFLEHMLFLGTEKYPDGSEYQHFISQHGGSNNAWTATEHTCFFFDIQGKFLAPALDRFSQFFTSPLLSEEFVQSERQNIDAEFKMKLKDDIRRLYDVHKETINPNHPFAKFSVGNIETLEDRNGQSVSSEVRNFFEMHYNADSMTLAVEGPQSIAELESMVCELFSGIANSNKPQVPITEPLYKIEHQKIQINVCPIRNDHQLIISFAMNSIDDLYKTKPESIIAYLLGHEGEGSILSLLKKQQWGLGLTAGSGINGSNFKDFNISISLTELGEQHIEDIIEIVFSYLHHVNANDIAEFYYEEKQKISDIAFIYHEKMRPLDSVSQLVINMHHYPVDDYIYGDYIMTELIQDEVQGLLKALTPSNMRIIHISQNNEFDKTSFWYKAPYQVNTICERKINHWLNTLQTTSANTNWCKQLHLPRKNPYIVAEPEVYPNQQKISLVPCKIVEESGLTVWYKQDNTFKVPKGYIYIGIDSPHAVKSIETIAMTRLFVDLYTDTVIEENYDAELAGIHYHLYAHQGGVTLQLSGMSEKQNLLLDKLLIRLKHHNVSKEQFTLFKKQSIKHWHNSDKSKSISLLFSQLSSLMQPNNPSSEALITALENVEYADYIDFTHHLFDKVNLEVLIHGNWLENSAHEIAFNLKKHFQRHINANYAVQCPVLDLHNQQTLFLPIHLAEHDYASVMYTPMPVKDNLTIALTMIASHLLSPVFFQEMRTDKQYGYLVGVGYVPINQYPGIAFYIQSPHTNSIDLSVAIEEFIDRCLEHIFAMSKEKWQHFTNGLAGQLQEKDHNLRIKSQRFWASICNDDTEFAHKENLLNTILSLSIEQVITFIREQLFSSNSPDRLILLSSKANEPSLEKAFELQLLSTLNGKIINNHLIFTKNSQRKY